jgi:lysophospholipase L1-like esterase
MSARGRLLSCLVTIVIALAGFVAAGALPAGAAPSTIDYVALGDSYAAGTAAAGSFPNCPHGLAGYPTLLDKQSRIQLTANATCSGATTTKVAENLPSALNGDTRLVTLTVGAADLGLSTVLAACADPTSLQCRTAILKARGLLGDCADDENSLYRRLTALYTQVAGEAPEARIVVTGYPLLFESPDTGSSQAAINDATAELNCIIERAVTAAKDADVDIYYVDVTEEFLGHGIGCTEPECLFINEPPNPDAFHPNDEGYIAYADAIKTKLPRGWLDKPQT